MAQSRSPALRRSSAPCRAAPGAFYFDEGILGFEDFRAVGNFFPSPNPTVSGNLSHTADYSIKVRFKEHGRAAVPVLDVIRLAIR
ncbi:MAG: hypothetical protein JOZ81_29450 [Chloroflexi bacterium]|nr:hypothetical protein [Chloroflexota bacterium]